MCGIAGYLGDRVLPPERLSACEALMQRRGPDAAGQTQIDVGPKRRLYLLHSRLSIIDLDPRANQPFRQGSDTLIFNGEIYNYRELRGALETEGCRFRSASDTEVLAQQLVRKGWAGLDSCEGMWAFAWYDSRNNRLILSRDRFGEKPLYVYTDATGVYFGSEVKFIAALRGGSLPVNYDHLRRYLVHGYKSLYKRHRHGVETFYEGLSEIEPGTVAVFNAAGARKNEHYWTPKLDTADERLSFADAVAQTRESLIRSVRLRLRADVPLAFCLSGGIDSNALAGIARRVCDFDVHGFTIMNTDSRYEERAMVETSVRELGLRHTALPVDTDSFIPRLTTLIRQHDAPVYTITYYAQWRLHEAMAQQGYRISISGTGADELFSGYYDHHNAYLYAVRDDEAGHKEALAAWHTHIAPIVRNPFLQEPMLFLKNPEERGHIYLDADKFAGFLKQDFDEAFAEERYSHELLRNRMANELFHEAVPPILHEDDLNAMFYSIENRSPFLDRELFECCQTIPTRHLVRNGRTKAVLREAVRGLVPDEILDNPRKVGFNAPIFDYLDVNDPVVRDELLAESPIFDHIRRDRIEDLILKPDLPNSESKFLFYFLNAKIFLEQSRESYSSNAPLEDHNHAV